MYQSMKGGWVESVFPNCLPIIGGAHSLCSPCVHTWDLLVRNTLRVLRVLDTYEPTPTAPGHFEVAPLLTLATRCLGYLTCTPAHTSTVYSRAASEFFLNYFFLYSCYLVINGAVTFQVAFILPESKSNSDLSCRS